MNKRQIIQVIRKPIVDNKWFFVGLIVTLMIETIFILLLPEILGNYIDKLGMKQEGILGLYALGYCLVVVLRSGINTCNIYISEKVGWKLCDYLRVDLFRRIFNFKISFHKKTQEGDFVERLEGDVNQLLKFFSIMLIDICSSLLIIIGVLYVFFSKYMLLGGIFIVITIIVLSVFLKTQEKIASLWRNVREKETDILDEFSQDVAAYKDIYGTGKKNYIVQKMERKFKAYEKDYVKASFLGNIPSTVFFSILNIGEGIALVIGIYLLKKGQVTLGEVYLMLSYVTLLNAPFFTLKYELSQVPMVLAALKRINDIYSFQRMEDENGSECPYNNSIKFKNVSFGYNEDFFVLRNISFDVENGQHILIQGRTGSGKSTILQLIAGFYLPIKGEVLVGGKRIFEYEREKYNRFIYYILQNNPILKDTVKNNITRYDYMYSDEEIRGALEKVKMSAWLNEKKQGLNSILSSNEVTKDEAQLLAWAGAVLRKPRILLVDEFDSMISENTIRIIDELVESVFKNTTIIMVTHRNRSKMQVDKKIVIEDGRI